MYRFVEGMTMFNKFVENKAEFFRMVDQLEFPGDILEPVAALVSEGKDRSTITSKRIAFAAFRTCGSCAGYPAKQRPQELQRM